MPKDTRALTRAGRARAAATGESYTAARAAVLAAREQADERGGAGAQAEPRDDRSSSAAGPATTDATIGVVRPAGGRWWAAHGLGSYTRELGFFGQLADAEAMAGAGGRRIVHCQPGETGWTALAREGREAVAGGPVPWMTLGSIVKVSIPDAVDVTLALAERGTPVAHLDRYPPVTDCDLVSRSMAKAGPGRDRDGHLVLTRAGEVTWLARGEPRLQQDMAGTLLVARAAAVTAARELMACGRLHPRTARREGPAGEDWSGDWYCTWCLGIAWQGDLEPPWPRRPRGMEDGQ